MKILGIGSRIKHSEFGLGVVTNVTSKHYWVTFIENGLETIDVDSEFEVIEAVEDEVDSVSFYEVEKTLKNILQKWSDVTQIVPDSRQMERWKISHGTRNTNSKQRSSYRYFFQ
jgi:hypothetical protein